VGSRGGGGVEWEGGERGEKKVRGVGQAGGWGVGGKKGEMEGGFERQRRWDEAQVEKGDNGGGVEGWGGGEMGLEGGGGEEGGVWFGWELGCLSEGKGGWEEKGVATEKGGEGR